MIYALLVVLSALYALPAMAQNVQATTIQGACRLIETHTPRDDVAHVGDSVVPADIGSLNGAIGTVHIPITIDLASRFGIDVPLGADLEPEVAVIGVQPDGRVYYNGRDLSPTVATVCGQNHQADGQVPSDALGSSAEQ